MEVLIIAFLLFAATRGLVQQTKRDLARWRGRPAGKPGRSRGRVSASGAGYWGHQAAHGLPSARAGLHDGWMRGREAHHAALRAIAQGRAEHAEGLAELDPDLEELRRRRRQALQRLEQQRAERDRREWDQWMGREARAGRERLQDERERALPEEPPWAEDTREPEGIRPDPPGAGDLWEPEPEIKEDLPAPAGSQAEGDGPMAQTETTYAGVTVRMQSDRGAAEAHQAEAKGIIPALEERVNAALQAKAWAQVTLDQMRALQVDGAVLAAMDDHMTAHAAAIKAEQDLLEKVQAVARCWARCTETAGAVLGQLNASGHGNVNEAHAAAAQGGAEAGFYEPR